MIEKFLYTVSFVIVLVVGYSFCIEKTECDKAGGILVRTVPWYTCIGGK